MNTDSVRKNLTNTTNEALQNGAYGVPWLTLEQKGKETIQLFGSDRLNILCHLLNVKFEGKLGGIVKLESFIYRINS
jgi:2-hydroxychromene-2-carboxylate isomerase